MNSYLPASKYKFIHGFVPACSSTLVVSILLITPKLLKKIGEIKCQYTTYFDHGAYTALVVTLYGVYEHSFSSVHLNMCTSALVADSDINIGLRPTKAQTHSQTLT